MEKSNLHFKSNISGIISINGEYNELIDNDKNSSTNIITNTNKLYVTFLPECNNKSYLTTSFMIYNLATIPNTNCNSVSIIPFPFNHFDVIMTPYIYKNYEPSTPLYYVELKKELFVSVYNDSSSHIVVFENENIKYQTTIEVLKSVYADIKNETIIIKGEYNDGTFYLCIISIKNYAVIFSGKCNSIEENENEIRFIEEIDDAIGHGIVTKYNFIDNKSSNYLVSTKKNSSPKSPYLVPEYFLECLKIKDLKNSRRFLSGELQNASDEHLIHYFGNIQNIYLNTHNDNYKVNYTIKIDNNYKNYNFTINNNKIIEIEEVF